MTCRNTTRHPSRKRQKAVAAVRRFSGRCCFQVIYFKSKISSSPPARTRPTARVETIGLTHAVKNAWASPANWPVLGKFQGPGRGRRSGEITMSKRIAVALLATIGAGLLATNAAQARPEMVPVRGAEYSPGTIVVKTGERHLYLILDSGKAMRYPVGV